MAREADGIIEVRQDEMLPLERLLPYLAQHLPAATGPADVQQFSGGHANLTYLIRYGTADFVLRRPPMGPVAKGAHDMVREHRILSRLYRGFPLAPRSFLLCEDVDVLGAPFFVMERRKGFVIHSDMPAAWAGRPDLNARIGEMLIDTLAALHLTDPAAVDLDDLGRPEGFAQRQFAGWVRRWDAAEGGRYDNAATIVDWLSSGVPVSPQVALLHNDFKLNNLILDEADPTNPVAVVDWDMCSRGDPLFDLGYVLNYWLEPGDPENWRSAAAMPTWRPGFPTRQEAIACYAEKTGFNTSAIAWYQVFGVFKLMGILQQILLRYERGQTEDDRFATFGARIEGLIDKALVLMERS